MNSETDASEVERETRGSEGGECGYEECESEASTLVRFAETGSDLHIWFCGPHAGNSVKKHDDAEVVRGDGL